MAPSGVATNGNVTSPSRSKGLLNVCCRAVAARGCLVDSALIISQLQDPSLVIETAYVDGTWLKKEKKFAVFGQWTLRRFVTSLAD